MRIRRGADFVHLKVRAAALDRKARRHGKKGRRKDDAAKLTIGAPTVGVQLASEGMKRSR